MEKSSIIEELKIRPSNRSEIQNREEMMVK